MSSPDPLGGSLTFPSSPTKGIRLASPSKTAASAKSREKGKLQEVVLTTPPPAKPQRSASSSPWRIRVTVEAENDEEEEHTRVRQARSKSPRKRAAPRKQVSPHKQLETRTVTTTVPLNDGEGTTMVSKRGRGRPRKSPAPNARTRGTPAPAKGQGNTQKKSRGNENEEDKTMGTGSSGNSSKRKRTEDVQHTHSCRDEEVDLVSDCSHSSPLSQSDDFGQRSPRRRKAEAKRGSGNGNLADLKESSRNPGNLNGIVSSNRKATKNTNDVASLIRPLKVSTAQSQGVDPTNTHTEFDSIIESEGFSVVSLSSVPSAQQYRSSSDSVDSAAAQLLEESGLDLQARAGKNVPPSREHDSHAEPMLRKVLRRNKGGQDIHEEEQAQSRNTTQKTTPRLSKIIQAGIALQGVLGPPEEPVGGGSPLKSPDTQSDPMKRMDGHFDGFGAKTRRELRAGLRLGEEIAKKQRSGGYDTRPRRSSNDRQSATHEPSVNSVVTASKNTLAADASKRDSDVHYPILTPQETAHDESCDTSVLSSDEEMGNNETDAASESRAGRADETDIWQLEAKSASQMEDAPERSQAQDDGPTSKRTRSKLPVPWKSCGQGNGVTVGFAGQDTGLGHTHGKKRPLPTSMPASRKSQKQAASRSPQKSSPSSDESEEDDTESLHEDPEGQIESPEHEEDEADDAEEDADEDGDENMEIHCSTPAARVLQASKSVQKRVRDRLLGEDYTRRTTSSSERAGSTRSNRVNTSSSVKSTRSSVQPTQRATRQSTHSSTPKSPTTTFLRNLADFTFNFMFTPPTIRMRWPLTQPQWILGSKRPQPPPRTPSPEPAVRTFPPAPPEKTRPLSRRLPIRIRHWDYLVDIYLAAQEEPHLYPLDPAGGAARYRGQTIRIKGWEKKLEDWELAVADEFIRVLEREAVVDGPWWAYKINVRHAMDMVFKQWATQVQQEEVDLTDEVAGDWCENFLHTRERVLEQQRQWKAEHGRL